MKRHQNEEEEADAELLFSNALLNLTYEERNAITDEIHGVTSMAVEETPELLDDSLRSMNLELDRIEEKPAHDKLMMAITQRRRQRQQQWQYLGISFNNNINNDNYNYNCNSNYNCNHLWAGNDKSPLSEFGLRFLRCELFDAQKAAVRFAKYLNLIDEIFGPKVLYRSPLPIPHSSDFTKEEMSVLKLGYYQLLPYRDRSGRRVQLSVVPNADDANSNMPERTRVSCICKIHTYIRQNNSSLQLIFSNNVYPAILFSFSLSVFTSSYILLLPPLQHARPHIPANKQNSSKYLCIFG